MQYTASFHNSNIGAGRSAMHSAIGRTVKISEHRPLSSRRGRRLRRRPWSPAAGAAACGATCGAAARLRVVDKQIENGASQSRKERAITQEKIIASMDDLHSALLFWGCQKGESSVVAYCHPSGSNCVLMMFLWTSYCGIVNNRLCDKAGRVRLTTCWLRSSPPRRPPARRRTPGRR